MRIDPRAKRVEEDGRQRDCAEPGCEDRKVRHRESLRALYRANGSDMVDRGEDEDAAEGEEHDPRDERHVESSARRDGHPEDQDVSTHRPRMILTIVREIPAPVQMNL